MNQRSDIDRILQVWMADGPTVMPDRVVDVVATRIGVQRQRRAWPFPGRTTVNNLKLIAAVAAVLILGVVGYNLLPGQGVGVPHPTPTAAPTPTLLPTPSFTATPEPIACEDDLPGCLGPLSAGAHESSQLEPKLFYETTGEPGEWLNVIDLSTVYKIDLGNPNDPYVIAWTNVAIGNDLDACVVKPTVGAGNTVQDWIDMLQAHPGLDATTPTPIDLGGSKGQSIEVTVKPGYSACPSNGTQAVTFIIDTDPVAGTIPYGVGTGQRMLLDIIDVDGKTVILQVYGPTNRDTFLNVTQKTRDLIDTFKFGCGGSTGRSC
jgi:hypothetical protein